MGRSLGFGGQARIFVYEGRVVYVDSDWTCADPTHKKTKIMMNIFFQFGLPLICATLAFIYWRRASIGLEDHLKQVSFGFLALAIFELLSLASLFRESRMVWLSKLVVPFGIINILQYMVLITAIYILTKWTWYYLLKRLETQLFMLALTGAVFLSLIITGLFVTLLLKSVESESLAKLTSNAKVISSLLDQKQARLLSEAKLFAQGIESLERKDLLEKVILKGENEEERGISYSEDPFVKRALKGEVAVGVVSNSAVVAPEILLRVAVPIRGGVLIQSQILDNAYMDGLKTSTGLSFSIYGDQLLSATTGNTEDGKSRLIGIKETNKEVINKVWKDGEIYATQSKMGEHEYLLGYVPLRDLSNSVVAVLQVSEPRVATLQTAGKAVQLTFAIVILVMIVLSIPIYFVCQKLVKEWE